MYIYCVTNIANGKMYVGLTTKTVEERWKGHLRSAERSNTVLAKAIRKYGEKSFDISAIDIAETDEQLSHKERFWIGELNTLVPNGYNLTEGGFDGKPGAAMKKRLSRAASRRFSKEGEREAQSKRTKRYFSDEANRERQSDLIRASFEHNPELREGVSSWSKHQWETRRELLISRQRAGWQTEDSRMNASVAAKARHASGAYDSKKKSVTDENGNQFESIVAAAKFFSVANSHVRNCIKDERPMKNGIRVYWGE